MMKVKIVFDSKGICYKFFIDISKIRLDEILECIEKQYPDKNE